MILWIKFPRNAKQLCCAAVFPYRAIASHGTRSRLFNPFSLYGVVALAAALVRAKRVEFFAGFNSLTVDANSSGSLVKDLAKQLYVCTNRYWAAHFE